MIDTVTKKQLKVSTDGTAGPYIMVPVIQLADLKMVLDKHNLSYSIEEEAISLNDAPEVAIVDLGRKADVQAIQIILNSIQ